MRTSLEDEAMQDTAPPETDAAPWVMQVEPGIQDDDERLHSLFEESQYRPDKLVHSLQPQEQLAEFGKMPFVSVQAGGRL